MRPHPEARRSGRRGVMGSGRSRVGGTALVVLAAATMTACGGDESSHTAPPTTARSGRPIAVVYRTPTCGCCKSYEEYLRKHGFGGDSEVLDDLEPIRTANHVPGDAASCHTVVIDSYAIEGHVPVEAIDKLLAERPDIDGIGIPGMPSNAPGMGERDGNPLLVVSFKDGQTDTFVTL